jgi:hypothetical protein
MADEIYLSYWLRDPEQGLPQFERLLRRFPFSRLARRAAVLRTYALEQAEPPQAEYAIEAAPDPAAVVALARELAHRDVSFQLEAAWDLLQWEEDWKLAPSPVVLACFGPAFDNPAGDHLRVELGRDTLYLPDPERAGAARAAQANLRSVVQLTRDLDAALEARERRLWNEAGEDLADLLIARA